MSCLLSQRANCKESFKHQALNYHPIMNFYLDVEYSHLLRLEQQKLASLSVLCTLYTLLNNSIGSYYYTHFTDKKRRFAEFE